MVDNPSECGLFLNWTHVQYQQYCTCTYVYTVQLKCAPLAGLSNGR